MVVVVGCYTSRESIGKWGMMGLLLLLLRVDVATGMVVAGSVMSRHMFTMGRVVVRTTGRSNVGGCSYGRLQRIGCGTCRISTARV